MPHQPLETLFLWVGQPADEPEHLLMMLTDDPDEPGSVVYRPLMAVSREHADQLADYAQQAADGLQVPAVLREYVGVGAALGTMPLRTLEPRT